LNTVTYYRDLKIYTSSCIFPSHFRGRCSRDHMVVGYIII